MSGEIASGQAGCGRQREAQQLVRFGEIEVIDNIDDQQRGLIEMEILMTASGKLAPDAPLRNRSQVPWYNRPFSFTCQSQF